MSVCILVFYTVFRQFSAEMAAAYMKRRSSLPRQLKINGLTDPSAGRQSPIASAISPATAKSLRAIFSFDTAAHEDRIAEAWPLKCSYVVKEILHTERTYVQALGEIIRVSPLIVSSYSWVYSYKAPCINTGSSNMSQCLEQQ